MKENLAGEIVTGLLKAACILMLVSYLLAPTNGYSVDSVELIVYRDGLVHVTQALVVNETFPAITVKLLAPMIDNVIVVDENNTLLDYEVNEFNMTIVSLGAKRVVIDYDTVMLTRKEAGVWTLTFDAPYNLTVKLPEESTIIYLNKVPLTISTEGNRTILRLFPGLWEISYVPPIPPTMPPSPQPPTPTASAPPTTPTPSPQPPIPTLIPLEYLIASAAVIAVVGILILYRRRAAPSAETILKKHPELRTEDKDVLKFIAERRGKVLEAELREKFPELPRTTLWRLVKRLEKMEIVTIKKVGFQNEIQLKK